MPKSKFIDDSVARSVETAQVLEKMGLWQTLQNKMARGNNANQAYQFTASGAAELGFIAFSQYQASKLQGSHWLVTKNLYDSIQQGAVLLKKRLLKN